MNRTWADVGEVRLVHAIPGRVRVRIPRTKIDPELSEQIRRALTAHPAVRQVEMNPITGSVLVHYDPGEVEAVAQSLEPVVPELPELVERFARPREPREDVDWGDSIGQFFKSLNARVGRATGGVDLKVIVPAALLLLGVHRMVVAKSIIAPRWYEFVWFCFNSFLSFNRRSGVAEQP